MNLLNIFLQESTGGSGGGISMIVMMVAIFGIMYFFMIRPQQKRQKEIQKAREAIKVGDKVLTSGGLHGKVREISEGYMVIEISEGVKVRIDKGHIFAFGSEEPQKK